MDGQHQAYLAQELINRNRDSKRPMGVSVSLNGVILANPDKAERGREARSSHNISPLPTEGRRVTKKEDCLSSTCLPKQWSVLCADLASQCRHFPLTQPPMGLSSLGFNFLSVGWVYKAL